jgi:hypothetical protein
VQALVDLIERFEPGFAEDITPADDKRIASLERLGGPLPGALRRFLRTMGGAPPRKLVDVLYLNVDFMRRALLNAEWLKDERYLILSRHEAFDAHVWLDRAAPSGADDCLVVISPCMEMPGPPPPRTPFAIGLEDYLSMEAFRQHRLGLFEHHSFAMHVEAPDELTVQRALALPLSLGCERVAATVPSGLFERGDAAVIVRRAPGDSRLDVHIAAESVEAVGAILDAYLTQPNWAQPT